MYSQRLSRVGILTKPFYYLPIDQSNKLEQESKHYMKHRVKINKGFKFKNTDINYNFSSNNNYVFGSN
jgi:hypothetical protein